MPYDEDGNWIDPEDEGLDTEGAPSGDVISSPSTGFTGNSDMAEYLRRSQLQSQMGSGVATAPAEYKAPPIGPEETRFRALEHQAPIKQNFPVSGWRKALGMLAGAASGNPSVREGITDYKYNHAQQDFQQKLGIQQTLAAEEEAATQRANVASHLGAQTEAEKARREAEAARGARYQWMISPEGQKFELDKARIQHPGTAAKAEYHEAELNDGSKVQLVRTPEGRLKNVDTGEMVLPGAIKQLSDPGKSLKSSSEFKGVLAEDVQAHTILQEEIEKPGTHPPAVVEAAKAYIKSRTEGKDPQTAFGSAQKALEDEKGRKLTSKEIVDLQNRLQPIQKPPQSLAITPEGEAIRVAPGVKVPEGSRTMANESQMNTPTAATRGRGEAAQTAIRAGQDVINFANQNRQGLGQLGNYWKELISGTPAADPTVAQFQGKIASWAAFQAAAHGFRASTVMREFEDRIGKGQKNVDAVIATIDGINSELSQAVITGQGRQAEAGGGVPKPGEMFNGHKVTKVTEIHK